MEIIATIKELKVAEALVADESSTPEYFRVNSSHMETPALVQFIEAYGKHPKLSKIPLYIDLQGAKLRIDRGQTPITIAAGEELYLRDARLAADPIGWDASKQTVRVSRAMLGLIAPGTDVAIDDGRLGIRVTRVAADEGYATAIVTKAGELRPGKGFNLRPHPIVHKELSERDRDIVSQTKHFSFVRYALSFACLPAEVAELRAAAGEGRFVAVKLEMAMDKKHIMDLADSADEMWICRGDLTVQLGSFRELARYYRELMHDVMPDVTKKCRMVMAGEVLEHMCGSREPTRSEVCHVADLMTYGFVAIVVSDETAFGKFPVEVVKTFKEIVRKD